ncbi:unnamed protein product, partial [Ectocarpus fasciculatus]
MLGLRLSLLASASVVYAFIRMAPFWIALLCVGADRLPSVAIRPTCPSPPRPAVERWAEIARGGCQVGPRSCTRDIGLSDITSRLSLSPLPPSLTNNHSVTVLEYTPSKTKTSARVLATPISISSLIM